MQSDGPTLDPEELLGHAGWMRALARVLLNDASRADDVVQEAWVAAVRRPPREKGAAGAWLARVVRNFALRARTADLRRRAREERAARPERDDDTPERVLQRAELHRSVVDAVLRLDEPFRTTVLLRFFEGCSTGEIARRERVHVATVRWRLRKALATLRERLDRRYDGDRAAWRLVILPIAFPPAFPPTVTQSASATATSSVPALQAGGIIAVSAKKLIVTVAASIAILAAGFLIFQQALTPGRFVPPRVARSSEVSAGRDESTLPSAAGERPEATSAGRPEAKSAEALPAASVLEAVLAGSVRDASGDAISGARVAAIDLDEWAEIAADQELEALKRASHDVSREFRTIHTAYQRAAEAQPHAETDESGVYRFAALDGGEYRLVVTHDDFLPAIAEVRVSGDSPTRRDFELAIGLTIRGRVTGENGEPVEGASIFAELSSDRSVRAARKSQLLARWREGTVFFTRAAAASGADGAFRLGGLPSLRFDVAAAGFHRVSARAFGVRPGTDTVELVLSSGRSVSGRVVDRQGTGLEDVRLVVTRASRPPAVPSASIGLPPAQVAVPGNWDFDGAASFSIPSGPDGRFRFEGLAPGAYELSVRRADAAGLDRRFELESTDVDLGNLLLEPGFDVAGRVIDGNGRAIEHALVYVEAREAHGITHWGGRRRAARALTQTRTGASGRFRLRGLAPGAYRLFAASSRHLPGSTSGVRAGDLDVSIVLREGRSVRGDVSSSVGGGPIAGAHVVLLAFSDSVPAREKEAFTDGSGRFELHGLARENLTLRVSHPDFSRDGTRVVVTEAQESVEVRLSPPLSVAGRVVDKAGLPVARARVSVEVVTPRAGEPPARSALPAAARSRDDGTYAVEIDPSLTALSDASLEVIARHARAGVGRSAPVSLAEAIDGELARIEVRLTESSRLEGSVRGLDGTVAGARLRLVPAGMRYESALEDRLAFRETSSAADGFYRFDLLEVGEYSLSVEAVGHAPIAALPVTVAGPGATRRDLQLEPGTTVAGRVVDRAGAAIAGADVYVLAAVESDFAPEQGGDYARDQRKEHGEAIAALKTDAAGAYRAEDLPRGDFTLFAAAAGFASSELVVVRAGDDPPPLVLGRFATLSGRVFDSTNDLPVAPFMVWLNLQKNRRGLGGSGMLLPREFQAVDGGFEFDAIPPGEYFIVFEAEGYAVWGTNLSLQPGAREALSVALERGLALSGRVVDAATGEGIAEVDVHATESDRTAWSRRIILSWRSVRTAADGSFSLVGLAPGEHGIYVRHADYSFDQDWVRAMPGGEDAEPLLIRLHRAASVEGRIRFLSHHDSFETSVRLRRADDPEGRGWSGNILGGAGAQAHERFQIGSVPPGEYEVFLEEKRFAPHMKGAAPGTRIDMERDIETTRTPLGKITLEPGETYRIEETLP